MFTDCFCFFLFWKLRLVYIDCSDNLEFLANDKTSVSHSSL